MEPDFNNLTPMQMVQVMYEKDRELANAIRVLRTALHNEADCERDYRKTRQAAWARVKDELEPKTIAKHQEDWVDAESAEARNARDHAVAESKVWYEKVRSLRQGLSMMQTASNSIKQELSFEQTRPE